MVGDAGCLTSVEISNLHSLHVCLIILRSPVERNPNCSKHFATVPDEAFERGSAPRPHFDTGTANAQEYRDRQIVGATRWLRRLRPSGSSNKDNRSSITACGMTFGTRAPGGIISYTQRDQVCCIRYVAVRPGSEMRCGHIDQGSCRICPALK